MQGGGRYTGKGGILSTGTSAAYSARGAAALFIRHERSVRDKSEAQPVDCKRATVDCEMGQLRREGWFTSPTRKEENAKGAVVLFK